MADCLKKIENYKLFHILNSFALTKKLLQLTTYGQKHKFVGCSHIFVPQGVFNNESKKVKLNKIVDIKHCKCKHSNSYGFNPIPELWCPVSKR